MRQRSSARALATFGEGLMKISALPGQYGAWIILTLTLVVVFTIIGAQLGWSHLLSWETSIPLFGDRLNMTGVAELQWHLFALLIMLAGAYTMSVDQHIRVDVVAARFSARTKLLVDIVGDVFLLVPFFGLLLWFSIDFVSMSYGFAEQSNSGGLIDRYLVKAVLPLGSLLMLLCAVGRALRNVAWLMDPGIGAQSLSCTQDNQGKEKP
ncbi:TRAP transporter small permease subunit [Paenalcaligenes niemegkensis]|uniref:TRAP transporter small permease subunit n=1 Tax=Paenalcaligenes niemegkensis TaxID=2895469 RepID=UPI001EE8BA32|nr:TRAP transporter small permease subunit [Paenalcaligenes niemegkensis]MCQ9617917.1 TRAP transporter small permease subunit [Paenalcaligenes niemegkensis]